MRDYEPSGGVQRLSLCKIGSGGKVDARRRTSSLWIATFDIRTPEGGNRLTPSRLLTPTIASHSPYCFIASAFAPSYGRFDRGLASSAGRQMCGSYAAPDAGAIS